MKRRKFVWIGSMFSLAFVFSFSGCIKRNKDLMDLCSNSFFLKTILSDEELNKLGLEYYNHFAKKKSIGIKELIDKIFSNEKREKFSSKDFFEIISKKRMNDFKTNKIVELDGWILSETEAIQVCLFYLKNTN